MKKFFILLILLSFTFIIVHAQQRVVAECTVVYSIHGDSTADKDLVESLKSSFKTVYIKSNNVRTDLVTTAFKQSVFYDKSAGNAIVLREFGNNKFMTKLDRTSWDKQNAQYDGMQLTSSKEVKTILGYECKKMLLQLKNGNSFVIYYASNIIPSVKDFEFEFKDVPGFVMEYEAIESTGKKLYYTATKIDVISPVPASKFDIPTNGYRLLN